VNLPSAKYVENRGIGYEKFLRAFVDAVIVDYKRLREAGSEMASKLRGKSLVRVRDPNGTDLTFDIEGRHVGVETGTLEDCLLSGRDCEVEIPAGEVYVAPVEDSADGTLVVDEIREHDIRGLELIFEGGRVQGFRAERGRDVFEDILEEAEGDKDRIAELGIGINYGMRPIGLTTFDEKALGTAHVAIGNNVHLGGANEASIHMDFVLRRPTITADNEVIIMKGARTS